MQGIKNGFLLAWDLFLDGVDMVTAWIERHPKVTLLLIVSYLAIRR